MEISNDDDIQSVGQSIFENVVEEVFIQLNDLYGYNKYAVFIRTAQPKTPAFLYETFVSTIAKNCREPCVSRAMTTAFE